MAQNFPVYLKFKGLNRFFKIKSDDAFEELQIMPNAYSIYQIKANQLPERNLIRDMLNNEGERWESIGEKEYEDAKRHCMTNLKEL